MVKKMKKENINTLNEINKGACMGVDAINSCIEQIENKTMKEIVSSLLEDYHKTQEKIEKIYPEYTEGEAQETSIMNKVMTWYGIKMKIMKDESDAKICEMLIQGINMGIIEGRKILNNKKIDKKIEKIVDKYVSFQELALDELKKFL